MQDHCRIIRIIIRKIISIIISRILQHNHNVISTIQHTSSRIYIMLLFFWHNRPIKRGEGEYKGFIRHFNIYLVLMNYSHANLANHAKTSPMNVSHTDIFVSHRSHNACAWLVQEISQRQVASPLLPSGMRTLDEVDKLRALIAMQPFREIREIRVKKIARDSTIS